MQKINDEMDDFMNVAGGGFTNIKELNDAFEGKTIEKKEEFDVVYDDNEPGGIKFKKKKRKGSVKRNIPKTAQIESGKNLDPIMEESKVAETNNMQMVPVTYEAQKKQRNNLLKMKAKAMTNNQGKVLFDIDTGENTFITGGGVPGRKKHVEEEDIEEKVYDCEEDKLLDNVDKMENDMKEMMKYLNEVESMMGGDDLSQIKRMMKCTD